MLLATFRDEMDMVRIQPWLMGWRDSAEKVKRGLFIVPQHISSVSAGELQLLDRNELDNAEKGATEMPNNKLTRIID